MKDPGREHAERHACCGGKQGGQQSPAQASGFPVDGQQRSGARPVE